MKFHLFHIFSQFEDENFILLRNMGAVRSFCNFSAQKEKIFSTVAITTVVKSFLREKPCSSIYQLCNLGSIACPLMPY